ncbi:hypothetical protein CIPAW_02G098700 [Carya illinoinensis]|uniref:Uncharacterized protein n=1 Tax=Carya illinoinensis TaxID=32201 RepID=A0A8T1RAN3_CARIL|nr:hypothetical protein CIPAW_02G098700 [Carya illinoinensis]
MGTPPKKINLISCDPMGHVSDIKLIRTDTTLDLSQKAEKGMSFLSNNCSAPPHLPKNHAANYCNVVICSPINRRA